MRSISAGPTPGWTGSSKRPGMTSSATGHRPRIFRSRRAFCLYSAIGYDGRRDFRHPIVETDEDVLVLRRLAVVPEEAGSLRDAVVVGDDHAAFARRHVLRRVEGEARGVAEVARLLAVVLRAGGLGRVLDYRDAAIPGGCENRVHLRGLAVQMDGHDSRRLARDYGSKLRRVHVVGRTIDVDEDGPRPAQDDRRRGREERQGRDDNLLARTDAVRQQGDMKCRGALRHGDRMPPAEG